MAAVDTVLINAVRRALQDAADPAKAEPMRAYMKSEQPFLGVPKPERTRVLRPLLTAHTQADRNTWAATVQALWDGAVFREERYAATALAQDSRYRLWAGEPDAVALYDHMIVTGAWWDHVDDLAIRSVGPVLLAHHDTVAPTVREWANDADRWRRRAAVICQIAARSATDTALLADTVLANASDGDFFLRKGIGWALREYSKTDPDWVVAFVAAHAGELSPLSRREALRRTQFPPLVTGE